MLAYAANRPVVGKAPSSPSAMLLIISAHVALIALVMSARMEFQPKPPPGPPLIRVKVEPPPPPVGTSVRAQHPQPQPFNPRPDVPVPDPRPVTLNPGPTVDPGPILAGGANSFPVFPPKPFIAPIRHEPRLLTPPDELKPPYPESKILSEEEATLQLRLTISDSGRVTAVEPVGAADRVFLEAARRYLIAHWRYKPATQDGRAVASSVTISLSFRLDG